MTIPKRKESNLGKFISCTIHRVARHPPAVDKYGTTAQAHPELPLQIDTILNISTVSRPNSAMFIKH
ncbi:hypothetical protein [Phaeobacter italicus]|uniref:hypothetical protein n=1 Tax=Phaeobacter italicus TaxID=481446 RepID=UPI001CD340E7|nr:hypothetical protein [Phaeobacter italicus]MCA0856885.1 hypothetical protein [Phaeobacter italicus]